MPLSDFDIQRTAFVFIRLHDDKATTRARKMVEEMRGKADQDAADTWLQITLEIGEFARVAAAARD